MREFKSFGTLEDFDNWSKNINDPYFLLVEVVSGYLYAIMKEPTNDTSSTTEPGG